MRAGPVLRFAALAAAAGALSALGLSGCHRHRGSSSSTSARTAQPPPVDPAYAATIQPLFDHRCVPCHSCFDSPCQLNLQSFEGADRGGNKHLVYQPPHVDEMAPTRMFQDAKATADWQSTPYDFFPVVDRVDRTKPADPAQSILWSFVQQRRSPAGNAGGPFDVDDAHVCPQSMAETARELHDFPDRGMPYGFPALGDGDMSAIATWLRAGSHGPPATSDLEDAAPEIQVWEDFLGERSPASQLVARYLCEHLFLAHVRFESAPDAWFRLVRSRTPPGQPIDEIATRRPYDSPGSGGARMYYRFRRVHETIVEKTHIPYLMSPAKLARIKALFFDGSWSATSRDLPAYDADVAANPFVTFAKIPARARYQFMLDDALYQVKTFIHGPVCKGQVALNVIDEHFLIFFLAPGSDPAVTDAHYLDRVAGLLTVPAAGGEGVEAMFARFKLDELRYVDAQKDHLSARAFTDVWHGDGTNPDGVLTVYRHFDSAFVTTGAVGGPPKTAWVLDYPIFERMYYDLVAGFDVYGSLIHQTSTRQYMNLLRIEAEDQFLRFLPASQRGPIRDSWYRGTGVSLLMNIADPLYGGPDAAITFASPEGAKNEFIRRLLTQELPPAEVGAREPIQWSDAPLSPDPLRARFEAAMRGVVATPAAYVGPFPDSALLRITRTVNDGGGPDLVYTIIRNRSHANIDFMFLEADELRPAEDTLHVASGILTSRPSFLFTVKASDLDAFVAAWKSLPTATSWAQFVATYGARRGDPTFWSTFDSFENAFPALDPVTAGVLDLSRYTND